MSELKTLYWANGLMLVGIFGAAFLFVFAPLLALLCAALVGGAVTVLYQAFLKYRLVEFEAFMAAMIDPDGKVE